MSKQLNFYQVDFENRPSLTRCYFASSAEIVEAEMVRQYGKDILDKKFGKMYISLVAEYWTSIYTYYRGYPKLD